MSMNFTANGPSASAPPFSPADGLDVNHQKQKQVKRPRQKKGEYVRKLEEENKELKDLINQYQVFINIKESENKTLSQQLEFFKKYQLPGTNINQTDNHNK